MKIFIGCSSSDEINEEYKIVTKYLVEKISKDNDLVFGCTDRGLMSICYNGFLKNNRKIIGICYEMYKEDLKNLKIDKLIMVNSLEESNKALEKNSDLIIFLPGAFGTLSEFIYILETKRTKLHNKDLILLNINGFYNEQIKMFSKINNHVSKKYDFEELCKVYNSVDDLVEYIYRKK